MAPMRLTCYLIVFLLMALLSNAHFQQAAEVEAEAEAVSTSKGVFNGESVVAFAKDQRVLGGRKMAVVNQETVVGHAKCKKNNGGKISEEGDDKEFVAFNADYRAPRHHPPKNN